ncbi:BZ3500_MvSof-1268-A1-R1_Chr7-1g09417 [Microbotryum saponariae]|uniref:BZ3500_MvSof-1268-A1-R1_Chr7-1g09417 protein n=1 Tax=Microbotryum saponariae TaxID=289078 RepID=A0A2X0L981_9BASI|nr:BZ3501_MvSof-1269-A2-R1_Chr7-1g09122 [Microbotryum saponariae]SDA03401.1 BZ3500_MvSof-1268-A1-R1_Chr7-1g09417 [Microbotryum saponariae]
MASTQVTDPTSACSPSTTSPERERLEARTMPAPPPFLFDLPTQGSDVLNRLHAFLPQIRDANMRLEQQQKDGTSLSARDGDERAGLVDGDEDHEEQEEVVMLEEIESSDSSDSDDNDSDDDDEDEDDSDEHQEVGQNSKMGVGQAGDEDPAMAQPRRSAASGLSHLLDIQGNSSSADSSDRPTKALPSTKGKITLIQEIDLT